MLLYYSRILRLVTNTLIQKGEFRPIKTNSSWYFFPIIILVAYLNSIRLFQVKWSRNTSNFDAVSFCQFSVRMNSYPQVIEKYTIYVLLLLTTKIHHYTKVWSSVSERYMRSECASESSYISILTTANRFDEYMLWRVFHIFIITNW